MPLLLSGDLYRWLVNNQNRKKKKKCGEHLQAIAKIDFYDNLNAVVD